MKTFTVSKFKKHFQSLNKEDIVFFCGAGVSMAAPSYAPDWAGLRDLYTSSLFNPLIRANLISERNTKDLVEGFKKFLNQNDIWLKPEVVLHWLYSRFNDKIFQVLEVLDYGHPNVNHYGITDICRNHPKCRLVTTNFDMYFERALTNQNNNYKIFGGINLTDKVDSFKNYIDKIDYSTETIKILKPHGTTQDISTIKATIQQVSKTPNENFQDLFETFMKDKHIIIMGYSGNDYDIFPLLKKYSSQTKSVSWFIYNKENMKKDISKFNCSLNLVFGDLNKFFPHKNFKEIETDDISKKINNKFKDWSRTLSIEESGYVLCLIGMHTGFFDITKDVASILLTQKIQALTKARIYNILGIVYKRHKPKDAIKFYKRGIKSAYHKRYKNPITIANLYGNIGALYHEIGEQQKAIQYLSLSNKWAVISQSKFLYYSNLDDIGNCLREKGRHLEAIKMHNKCIRYFRANGNLIELSHSFNNKGLSYMGLKRYALAEKNIRKGLEIKLNETAELASIIRGYKNLGELQLLQGYYKRSAIQFEKAYKLALDFNDTAIIPELLIFLSYSNMKTNEHTISLTYWKEFQSKKHYIKSWKSNFDKKEGLQRIIYELQNEY